MRTLTVTGLLAAVCMAGCATVPPRAPAATEAAAPARPAVIVPEAAPPAAPVQLPTVVQSPSSNQIPNAPPTAAPKPKPPVQPGTPAKPSAPVAVAPVAAAKPQVVAPPVPIPTLDLTSLELRLRDTKAIGVFTKLSLKNQVDDLLGDFRALYKRAKPPPGPEFRQRYDLLLLKVLTLLQDGDPPLAAAISSSKEAIWGILCDPDKLSKI
jgi:hypothetical protein